MGFLIKFVILYNKYPAPAIIRIQRMYSILYLKMLFCTNASIIISIKIVVISLLESTKNTEY